MQSIAWFYFGSCLCVTSITFWLSTSHIILPLFHGGQNYFVVASSLVSLCGGTNLLTSKYWIHQYFNSGDIGRIKRRWHKTRWSHCNDRHGTLLSVAPSNHSTRITETKFLAKKMQCNHNGQTSNVSRQHSSDTSLLKSHQNKWKSNFQVIVGLIIQSTSQNKNVVVWGNL